MGYPFKDFSNKKFGRLLALRFSHKEKIRDRWYRFWICLCDCGVETTVNVQSLAAGNTKSCGCLKDCRKRYTHGDSGSKEYFVYHRMIVRCSSAKDKSYARYGGRGISVCERWVNSYENFLADMGRAPSPKHSIDRKDNNGNYEPRNCRWATQKEQANNKRNNRWITFNGQTKTLAQWCDFYKLNYMKALYALRKGTSTDIVFNQSIAPNA